jgi:hypothetical protein
MATIEAPLQQPRFAHNRDADSPEFFGGPGFGAPFIEAATQSWKPGALVYQTSGKIAEVGVSSDRVNTGAMGQVNAEASGVTDALVHVKALKPGDRYWMNVWHATKASAVLAASALGNKYQIRKQNGQYHVDIANAATANTYAWVQVVGFHPDDNANTIYRRVLVEFGGLIQTAANLPAA